MPIPIRQTFKRDVTVRVVAMTNALSVAYLGFKKWGTKFSLNTSAHTKGEGKLSFPNFSYSDKNVLPKGVMA